MDMFESYEATKRFSFFFSIALGVGVVLHRHSLRSFAGSSPALRSWEGFYDGALRELAVSLSRCGRVVLPFVCSQQIVPKPRIGQGQASVLT